MIEINKLEIVMKENIKKFRKLKNWSTGNLSDESGINEGQIKRYEAGSSKPSLDILLKLCTALDVTPNEILGLGARNKDQDLDILMLAIDKFTDDEKEVTKEVLRALILKHSASKYSK